MGINLRLVNFNQLFATSRLEPVILNDHNNVTQDDREKIERMTMTVYNNVDVFSNEPSCECQKVTGGYNVGVLCPDCHTVCLEPFSQQLENRVWIRSPKGVEDLINPIVFRMLSKRFTKAGFNLVEWLTNTDYPVSVERPQKDIDELLSKGVERGYNNFVRNFDAYFEAMCSLKSFSKKRENDQLRELFRLYRDCLFSKHIPLPNKSLVILEETNVGPYMDPTVKDILDAVNTIVSIDTPMASFTQKQRENRAIKTIIKLENYHWVAFKERLAKKPGIIRKNVFGTRVHFSSRAVISSNTDPHEYDELHLAWGHGVTMLRLHLINKLMRQHGYTPNKASALLNEYTVKYHPLLDQLFKEIIAESPGGVAVAENQFRPVIPASGGKGLVVVFERNPSLTRASTQRMRITRIKTDPTDPTITMSILAVNGFNADFDGDQMSMMMALDNKRSRAFEALAPHKNMYDPNKPRTLTSVATFPKPAASTISSWMKHGDADRTGDPAKRQFLEMLAM